MIRIEEPYNFWARNHKRHPHDIIEEENLICRIIAETNNVHQTNIISTNTNTSPTAGSDISTNYNLGIFPTTNTIIAPNEVTFYPHTLIPFIKKYRWDFGDGNTSELGSPTHTYSTTGSFTVSLEITNSISRSEKIVISNLIVSSAPTVISNFTESVISGQIPLTISFSSNTVYHNGNGNLNYRWDFGDGNTSLLANPTHSFGMTGSYSIKLQVTESNFGISNEVTKSNRITVTLRDLFSDLSSSVISRIYNLTPNTNSLNLFSSADDNNKIYIRNNNLWAADINWSCIPVYGSSGTQFNGILVAPDIIIQANHASTNGNIYFVDFNNNVYSSSISSSQNISSTDIQVVKLNVPVSQNIIPAKVLPLVSYSGSLVNITQSVIDSRYAPAIFTNQDRELKIGMIGQLNLSTNIYKSLNGILESWYSPVISGDSGAPVFVIIENQPVVLCTWYQSDFSQFSFGPSISNYINQINTAISNLGSTSSLAIVNLSDYYQYNQ